MHVCANSFRFRIRVLQASQRNDDQAIRQNVVSERSTSFAAETKLGRRTLVFDQITANEPEIRGFAPQHLSGSSTINVAAVAMTETGKLGFGSENFIFDTLAETVVSCVNGHDENWKQMVRRNGKRKKKREKKEEKKRKKRKKIEKQEGKVKREKNQGNHDQNNNPLSLCKICQASKSLKLGTQ